MKPILLILAAGMGSRYGGIKQIDRFGPNGEAIIQYSIYDALKTGFGTIVFIIRKSIETEFVEWISKNCPKDLDYRLVFQELSKNVPVSLLTKITDRQKPWGTGHAILCAKEFINTPFAVINADDYYGVDAFMSMANWLKTKASPNIYSMVGYVLEKTLSQHGFVTRGVCQIDKNGYLYQVKEHLNIQKEANGQIIDTAQTPPKILAPDTMVSMNLWGFHPSIFNHLEYLFEDFLNINYQDIKSEFFIPLVVDILIRTNKITVETLLSHCEWFGVTYKEDKLIATKKINKLIEQGIYPYHLL